MLFAYKKHSNVIVRHCMVYDKSELEDTHREHALLPFIVKKRRRKKHA